MLSMFSVTTPIFLLILLGYCAVRFRVIAPEVNAGFGRFVLYFALPALMFRALSSLQFHEMFNPAFLGAYALGSLAAFGLGALVSRYLPAARGFPLALGGMGMSCSNSGYFGYPVMLLVFASPPAMAFAMVLMVENLLMLPLTFALLEYGASRVNGNRGAALWAPLAKRVLGSPMMLAILAGVLGALLEIRLPTVLDRSLEMLAGAAAPVALFVIGGSLVAAPLRGTGVQTSLILVGKLLLHPLLVFAALRLMPEIDTELQVAAILFAAMPMVGIYPIIGGLYGQQQRCSSILMATTVAAFFTVSATLALLL